MATCKYCGKSGFFHQVTKNGMCPACENFVMNDFKNRSRIFNESKELFEKSENPDVVVSRIKVAKDTLTVLRTYEQKGIGIFHPLPSVLLNDVECNQDDIIFECFERAYEALRIRLLGLKTPAARKIATDRFIDKVDKYLPEIRDLSKLQNIRNKALLLNPQPIYSDTPSNKKPKLLNHNPTKTLDGLPITHSPSIKLQEIHPAKLLYIEKKGPDNFGVTNGIKISINISGITQFKMIGPIEPSTIYENMPVKKPVDINSIERPPYYPTYSQLSQEQRWIYLQWLNNISQPINIGYVFIYYYGLERNLLLGDFDTAFQEIIFLRHNHENRSFESYSYNALLYASAIKNRPDLIESILLTESRNGIDNIDLLFKYRFSQDINLDEMITLARKIKGANLRYIKALPEKYKAALALVLIDKFAQEEYPVSKQFEIEKIPKHQSIAFANVSFPDELRTPSLPDFINYEPFVQDCLEIFAKAHLLVKEDLIRERLIKE